MAMPAMGVPRATCALTLAVGLATPGCVFQHVEVRPLAVEEKAQFVASPVKAHLKDGSTVVFRDGVSLAGGALQGQGLRYDIDLGPPTAVASVPFQSVAAVESFRTRKDVVASAVVSVVGVAAGTIGGAYLFKAIFGSCPTVYSGTPTGMALETETFTHSIAPLLESRDLARLRARADESGRVALDVRNEALETHYINHLQLLEVAHRGDTLVAPDPERRPLAVDDVRPFATAVDRAGRDVTALVAEADGEAFATDGESVAHADTGDLEDWLDLEAPVDDSASGAARADRALVLRLKDSLLGTVLFYDVMLAGAGPRAVGWMAGDLDRISTAVALGRWVQRRMGMRVSVWKDGWREVARLPDTGPIAWKDQAVAIPVDPAQHTLRVRLSFTPDLWRIDRVALGRSLGRPAVRTIAAAAVIGSDGRRDPEALAALSRPDGRYLQTTPGQRFRVEFEAGPAPSGAERTFLLSSQGYYTEWIRGDWLMTAGPAPFRPSDEALRSALRRWKEVRGTMEDDFQKHRIPVS